MEPKGKLLCDDIVTHADKVKNAKSILIHGNDTFQRENCFNAIYQILGSVKNDGLNSFLYYGDEIGKDDNISGIMEALNMLSFDLSRRIVAIRQFNELSKIAQERIATYTEKPDENNVLIIMTDKLNGRYNSTKTIMKNCLTFETTEMKYPDHLYKWLSNYISKELIYMNESTKRHFVDKVEIDAFTAYNEIKKLELYTRNNRSITIEDINACTVASRTNTVFDLIDAIGNRNRELSLKIVENLISNEESIIMIISMLTNFFTTLWKLSYRVEKGASDSDLKNRYMNEMPPFLREKYIPFVKKYPLRYCQHALRELYLADCRAKLSMASEPVLATTLILSITR